MPVKKKKGRGGVQTNQGVKTTLGAVTPAKTSENLFEFFLRFLCLLSLFFIKPAYGKPGAAKPWSALTAKSCCMYKFNRQHTASVPNMSSNN